MAATDALSEQVPIIRSTSREEEAGSAGTYGQILGSSALIGAVSLLNLALGIVRTKLVATMLGPAGFGLMGLFTSIADLARTVAEMGINSSGVRQIAAAAGAGDSARLAMTVTVLRRVALVLGLIGALVIILFADVISTLTFGSTRHSQGVSLLSLAVFFRLVADGQGALIQGMRRIGDLARIALIGGLLGTVMGVTMIYVWGEQGIVPSLIAVAAMSIVTSTWYSRKVTIEKTQLSVSEIAVQAGSLLRLGIAFMGSALLMLSAAYIVRIMLVRQMDLHAAGLYQAAWTIGGLYVGVVLQSMGADFYPRLVGAIGQHERSNRLVNEQTHASLLLATPGILATLTLAPLVIQVFYSSDFKDASDLLRWFCIGMAMRTISWPMGYIIVAKNTQAVFFATELAWTVANVMLTMLGLKLFGLEGAGVAFFASYVFHAAMIYPIVHRMTGFRWSLTNLRTGALMLCVIAFVFATPLVLRRTEAMLLGLLLTVCSAAYSVRTLIRLVSPDAMPRRVRRMLQLGRLMP